MAPIGGKRARHYGVGQRCRQAIGFHDEGMMLPTGKS